MFKVGDKVVYATTGVCEVEKIENKQFGNIVKNYYILKPLLQPISAVFVPTDNERLTCKIHPVLTREQFDDVFQNFSSCEDVWVDEENLRRSLFDEILITGERAHLISMIRNLHKHQQHQFSNGKRLHLADERLLKLAETILFDEIKYVYSIEQDEVIEFLKKKLNLIEF